jgi:hypothetical protein
MAKGKNLRPGAPFIGEGERNGAGAGSHVSDVEPAESGPVEPWHGASAPAPVGRVRARLVFKY